MRTLTSQRTSFWLRKMLSRFYYIVWIHWGTRFLVALSLVHDWRIGWRRGGKVQGGGQLRQVEIRNHGPEWYRLAPEAKSQGPRKSYFLACSTTSCIQYAYPTSQGFISYHISIRSFKVVVEGTWLQEEFCFAGCLTTSFTEVGRHRSQTRHTHSRQTT